VPGRNRGLHEAPGQGVIDVPAQWYCQGEPFQHERKTLFASVWQLLGRADSLQKPGDYLCANLAGWPVFALLNEKGELGAFRNVCSHQRMAVLDPGTGNCPNLRCKYHGWTYDLDGRFVSAPPLVAPAGAANDLQRIAVDLWQGLVFIALNRAQQGLADSLAQLPALDHLHFHGERATDLGCNWKLYVEHCLSEDLWSWSWPNLIARHGERNAEVQQVIPRSFSRTRVVQYFLGTDDLAAEERMTGAKAVCERAQKSVEEGRLPAANHALVQAFRAMVMKHHMSG
jgi:nitrite reductase/ring-hydroxylating ferredoxin subunit